jgi:hypothetical protein
MVTSFISEHSAEYILVANLTETLTPHFSRIIPIYFLSTREGSIISRECGPPSQVVKPVSFFARRPKIGFPGQPIIQVKFNESILQTTKLSLSFGIPTFAAVPLASSIFDLHLDLDCAWFELKSGDSDVVYELSVKGELLSPKSPLIEGPLSEFELVGSIRATDSMYWKDAVEALRIIRRGATWPARLWPIFGGGYHPFTLLLME